jgi:hypothetical protein
MKTLIATLAVGTAVAAAVALPATGQETPATRTLTVTSVQAKGAEHAIDTPPRGDSVGDRFVFASPLRSTGRLVGRMEGDCQAVDLKFEGLQCTLTAVLADGSITLQGASLTKHLPGATAPSQDVYAITGGTGASGGRAGTAARRGLTSGASSPTTQHAADGGAACARAGGGPLPVDAWPQSAAGRSADLRAAVAQRRARRLRHERRPHFEQPQAPPARRARSACAMCSRRTSGPSRSIARTSATWSAPTCSFVHTGLSWLTKSAISVLSAE